MKQIILYIINDEAYKIINENPKVYLLCYFAHTIMYRSLSILEGIRLDYWASCSRELDNWGWQNLSEMTVVRNNVNGN